jgi:hypothetical protein
MLKTGSSCPNQCVACRVADAIRHAIANRDPIACADRHPHPAADTAADGDVCADWHIRYPHGSP